MPTTVDHEAARKILRKAWEEINSPERPPARMQREIETVLCASDITFKYILVTAYLAKCVNRLVHARALQVGSGLGEAYDARSLCHKVVVGFEKEKGNLFGLSNEPFVNKPARHPEHDGRNIQLRNRIGAQVLHNALELAQTAAKKQVYQGLVHILRIAARHAAAAEEVTVATRTNLDQLTDFIRTFLAESDGGCRLVGVWGAFQALLSENGKVQVNSPNASDLFGKTCGDVEVYYDEVLVSAAECKQRPLNVDDVNHGIKKALRKGVPEYVFVISHGIETGQEEAVAEALKLHGVKMDLALIDIWEHARLIAITLNPLRRGRFGECVAGLLQRMRKFESANKAAEIWNRLTKKPALDER